MENILHNFHTRFESKRQKLATSTQDPLTLEQWEKPVVLVPCGHSLSESSAKTMYGAAQNLQVERPGFCPICIRCIVTYIPNYGLRDTLEGVNTCVNKIEAIAATTITRAHKKGCKKTALLAASYPGKSARFECSLSLRFINSRKHDVRLKMRLATTTPGSLLLGVTAYGYKNGTIRLSAICSYAEREVFSTYLSSLGFQPPRIRIFYAHSLSERVWLFRFLTANNKFPKRELAILRPLSGAEKWQDVEQEIRDIQFPSP